MKIMAWILRAVLAILFAMAGAMKIITPYEDLLAQMAWVESFTPRPLDCSKWLAVWG